MTPRTVLPVALALCALAVAAPAASAARSAAPSGWGKPASAICEAAQAKFSGIERGDTPPEIAKGLQKMLDIVIRQNADLARLPRPAARKADIAKLLGYYATQVGYVRGMVAALAKSDLKAADAWSAKGSALDAKATALARELGATSC